MGNQHSVSNFLTQPWERRQGQSRTLVYYDFETDNITEAKAKDLFARHDVHSDEIEQRFHSLIEDPLARLWHRVEEEGVKEVTDWREIRAAYLIFLAQPARIVDHAEDAATDDRKLDELLGMSDSYLDMMVGLQMNDYDLRLFGMPTQDGHPDMTASLFYPQTGLIGFPLFQDPNKKTAESITAGSGIPLHPQALLTMTPKTVHEASLARVRESFQAFSVGLTDSCRKVVIPATVADRYDHAELAIRIKVLRAAGTELVQLMVRLKEVIGHRDAPGFMDRFEHALRGLNPKQ